MKKKKCIELSFKNIKYFSIVAILTGLVFFSILHNINNNIFIMPSTDNKIIIGVFFLLNILFLLISFVGFGLSVLLIIFTIVLNTIAEKLDRKNFLKIQESLNTKDFSDVSLKEYDLSISIITVEEFVCTAKLDEKGNIVYKVSLDYVAQTDDYESFLRHFDI